MNKDQFKEDTQKIFEEAGAKITPPLYNQVYNKLSSLMATLSATEGLTYNRVEKYEEQNRKRHSFRILRME